jgi:CrcB protein
MRPMNLLRDVLLVFLGGGLGALTRYGIGLAMVQLAGKTFPWGTLIANVVGCFLAGVIGQRVLMLEPADGDMSRADPVAAHFLRVAVMVGFLGGLTTFSAFGWESVSRLVDKNSTQQLLAIANIAANLVLGLAVVWVGMQVAKFVGQV